MKTSVNSNSGSAGELVQDEALQGVHDIVFGLMLKIWADSWFLKRRLVRDKYQLYFRSSSLHSLFGESLIQDILLQL